MRSRLFKMKSHFPQSLNKYLNCKDHRPLKHKFSLPTGGLRCIPTDMSVRKVEGFVNKSLVPDTKLINSNSESGTQRPELTTLSPKNRGVVGIAWRRKVRKKSEEQQKGVYDGN